MRRNGVLGLLGKPVAQGAQDCHGLFHLLFEGVQLLLLPDGRFAKLAQHSVLEKGFLLQPRESVVRGVHAPLFCACAARCQMPRRRM